MRLARSIPIIDSPNFSTNNILCLIVVSSIRRFTRCSPLTRKVAPPTECIATHRVLLLVRQYELWLIPRNPYSQLLPFAHSQLIFQLSAQLSDSKRTKKNKRRDACIYKTVFNAPLCCIQSTFSPELLVGVRCCDRCFYSNFSCVISSIKLCILLSSSDGSNLDTTVAQSALQAILSGVAISSALYAVASFNFSVSACGMA